MDRGGIVVVLVLRRLVRLRLDQEGSVEADPVLVLGDQVHEPAELPILAPEVRIEERVVALAAAPEHVVLAAQAMRRFEHHLDLGRGEGEHGGSSSGCCGLTTVYQREEDHELRHAGLQIG